MRDIFDGITEVDYEKRNYLLTLFKDNQVLETALVSDGKIEASFGKIALITQKKDLIVKEVEAAENGCGTFLIEEYECFYRKIGKRAHLIICGAGHVGMAVLQMAKFLSMKVTVIEDREEFALRAKDAGADDVLLNSFPEGIATIENQENTFYVVVTRGHQYDLACLSAIAKKQSAYVGMMGSRKRALLAKETLQKEGICQAFIEKIHTPIGMEIHAETPNEIAVSIMAEVIAYKNQKWRYAGISQEMIDYWKTGNTPLVLCTVVSKEGSAPRSAGACMLVGKDGVVLGTIGGGSGEKRLIDESLDALKAGKNGLFLKEIEMNSEEAAKQGMFCGGRAKILMEVVGESFPQYD